jgi:carotenoid cleavage oxygenase
VGTANRWVRTPAVAHALGGPVPRRAPTRAGRELLGANTNVLSHAGRTVDVEVTGAPMTHDFSLTANHVVFYDLPVTSDPRQAAAITAPPGLRALSRLILAALIGRVRVPDPIMAMAGKEMGGNANLSYRWNRGYPARVGVMPRAGGAGDLRWFDVAPCYVFHPLNA